MKEIANNLEDDEVSMDVDSCSGHGRKQLLKIPSTECLRYNRFKQNVKRYNCM